MKIRIPVQKKEEPVKQGPPSTEEIHSVWGEITRYGTKIMPDGRIWVIHGLTGQPLERYAAVPVASDGKGNFIYLKPGEKIRAGIDRVHPSVWLNPKNIRGGV
jgi:hypothetical protein